MLIRQKSTCWVTHGGHDCTLVWWVRHPVCVKQAKMTFCLLFTSYSLLFRHYKAPHPSPLVTTVVLNFFVKYKNPDLLIPRWFPKKCIFISYIVPKSMINTDYYFLNINAIEHLDLIQFAFLIFSGYNLSKLEISENFF